MEQFYQFTKTFLLIFRIYLLFLPYNLISAPHLKEKSSDFEEMEGEKKWKKVMETIVNSPIAIFGFILNTLNNLKGLENKIKGKESKI